MIPSVAVITNRGSTRNLREAAWIESVRADAPDFRHFQMEKVSELPALLKACLDADVIVVNGGDGTAGLVFSGLLEAAPAKLPALALLSGGKTNMTAAGWSLRGDARAAFRSLLRHGREGNLFDHVYEHAVLRLRREDASSPLYGAFFGAAEFADVIRFCRRHIYPLGLPNAISHALALPLILGRSLLGKSGGGRVAIGADADNSEDSYFLVAVTALDDLLFGLRPAPVEPPIAGAVHLLGVRRSATAILGMLPVALNKRFTPGAGRVARQAHQVTLAFSGAYTLDGELYEATAARPLILDAGPKFPFIRLPV
ncbi:MAG: hypothetical protein EXQ84_05590 [Rhodospirillaceae bacterium]|nr:hypothetical protein [Rhodospirillaceae bacterium]